MGAIHFAHYPARIGGSYFDPSRYFKTHPIQHPMPTLLHLDSSPMGDHSISRHLTAEFVQQWRQANPGGQIIRRDLTATSIEPITGAAGIQRGQIEREAFLEPPMQAIHGLFQTA